MEDGDDGIREGSATFPRGPAGSARSPRKAGWMTPPSTREQDVLRDLARRHQRDALVYGSDVEAWLRGEGADSGRLAHEGRKLRRAMPNGSLNAACTAGAIVAGVALALGVADLVGQGWPGIAACLVIAAEAAALAVTAAASVRLRASRDTLRSRLAWIDATERERRRMACEVMEVRDDGILVRTLRDGSATARLIPMASLASCEVLAERGDGLHATFAVVTVDGTRTLFKWIPLSGGAANVFERFAKRVEASRTAAAAAGEVTGT